MTPSGFPFRVECTRVPAEALLPESLLRDCRDWAHPELEAALHPEEERAIELLARLPGWGAEDLADTPGRRGAEHPLESRRRLVHLLQVRALAGAREESLLWTPLLDALACYQERGLALWSYPGSWKMSRPSVEVSALGPRIELMARWLSAQQEREDVLRAARAMMRFQSKEVGKQVAEATSYLDEELLDCFLARGEQQARRLGRHPGLSSSLAKRLSAWAEGLILYHPEVVEQPIPARPRGAVQVLADLWERGLYGGPEQVRSWLERLKVEEMRADLLELGEDVVVGLTRAGGRPWMQVALLLSRVLDELEEGVVEEFARKMCPIAPVVLVDVVRSGCADLSTLRAVSLVYAHQGMPAMPILENGEARRDPEVRARLGQAQEPRTLGELLRDARGAEFAGLFRRLAHHSPLEAALSLERDEEEALRVLGPEDLQPLLNAENGRVRLGAIRFLGRLSVGESPRVQGRGGEEGRSSSWSKSV